MGPEAALVHNIKLQTATNLIASSVMIIKFPPFYFLSLWLPG